jgi:hypothetical protein
VRSEHLPHEVSGSSGGKDRWDFPILICRRNGEYGERQRMVDVRSITSPITVPFRIWPRLDRKTTSLLLS